MSELKTGEFRKKAAATAVAFLGMTGLAGCSDIISGGGDAPKTVSEASVYKQEGRIIRPGLIKIAGQAIKFWRKHKDQAFDPANDAYELKNGERNYNLTINTRRGGRFYGITVDMTTPTDPKSVYDVNVNSASDSQFEFGIDFSLSTKPWEASTTNYYTDYLTKKKKMHVFGDSTDNYQPGFEPVDGYNGFHQEDASQILKVARQSVRGAEHAVDRALSDKK